MSTVTARRILASPVRLSSAVWLTISDLITKGDSSAASEFSKVKGIASSLVNDELLKSNPLVVKNRGPRLRIYCLYGEDAINGEEKNEEVLSWSPTANSWHAFLPCTAEELEEMAALLAAKSNKFSLYDIEKGIPDDEPEATESTASGDSGRTTVNWGAFKDL